ncbi:MAG TPA: FAD binding domain-containing protein [Variovorax sp.]|nr:FAD binding domain-containing protein [Variovorax sp.]
MKPARFDYERPADLGAALRLLRQDDAVVKIVAGSQSLGPMLNLRLVQPDLLVDITGLAELKRVEVSDTAIVIGACVTHADIEDGRALDASDVTGGVLSLVARGIAYRAVRNRGTLGGSIVHADPSADWISSLCALGAEVLIAGPAGKRSTPLSAFMTGVFEVDLAPEEMLEAVRIPRLSPRARWGYHKLCRKTGEFAHAIGVVLHDPERGVCRVVLGATESKPIVVSEAARLFDDGRALRTEAARALLVDAGHTDALNNQIHLAALKRAALKAQQP